MQAGAGTGRYQLGIAHLEVGERIGGGGFADVHLGFDRFLRRHVAVKIVHGAGDAPVRALFEAEAAAHGAVSRHGNVVTVHHAGFTTNTAEPYLVMDYAAGGSLGDRLVAHGRLPWQHVVAWMIPICDAVQHVHDHGLLHRDIKPNNILLDPTGVPLLSDLGISCVQTDSSPVPALSLGYVAPEALRDERRGVASDVFSIGATMFQLLTGRFPFGRTLSERLASADQEPPAPAPEVECPAWLDALVTSALQPDSDRRPPSAGEMARLLRAGIDGVEIEVPDVGPVRDLVPLPTVEGTTGRGSEPDHDAITGDPTRPRESPVGDGVPPPPEDLDSLPTVPPSRPPFRLVERTSDARNAVRRHGPLLAAAAVLMVLVGVVVFTSLAGGDSGSRSTFEAEGASGVSGVSRTDGAGPVESVGTATTGPEPAGPVTESTPTAPAPSASRTGSVGGGLTVATGAVNGGTDAPPATPPQTVGVPPSVTLTATSTPTVTVTVTRAPPPPDPPVTEPPPVTEAKPQGAFTLSGPGQLSVGPAWPQEYNEGFRVVLNVTAGGNVSVTASGACSVSSELGPQALYQMNITAVGTCRVTGTQQATSTHDPGPTQRLSIEIVRRTS